MTSLRIHMPNEAVLARNAQRYCANTGAGFEVSARKRDWSLAVTILAVGLCVLVVVAFVGART